MPDAVAGAVAGYAREAPTEAYRGASRRLNDVRDRIDEERNAPLVAARRLDQLAEKRMNDPSSLTAAERAEIDNAEAMLANGKNPTSRVGRAARHNQKAAREEYRRRKQAGLTADQQLVVVPRRHGEREAGYLARQKEARQDAKGLRERVLARREDPEKRGLWPVDDPPEDNLPNNKRPDDPTRDGGDGDGGDGSGGGDLKPKPCARCQKAFVPATEDETICPSCRGGGPPGGDDPDDQGTRQYPSMADTSRM